MGKALKIDGENRNPNRLSRVRWRVDGFGCRLAVKAYHTDIYPRYVFTASLKNKEDADLLEFLQQSIYHLADNDGSSLIPPAVLRVLNSKACRGSGYIGSSFSIRFETKHDGCGLAG
nr:MutL protein homolog 3 [Tanacetum cinerariifolium]